MSTHLKRYLMRIRLPSELHHVYVEETDSQKTAIELAQERYPKAKEICARRLYNPSIDTSNDKYNEE